MCCGKKRQQYLNAGSFRAITLSSVNRAEWSRPAQVKFEYLGRTGLTVVGPVTGRKYRFERPGYLVDVDGRDAASLAAVPNLRQWRSGR